MANDLSVSMRPLARSKRQKMAAPRYSSLNRVTSAYLPPSGAGYCEVSMT
jgi:hypothetical protein